MPIISVVYKESHQSTLLKSATDVYLEEASVVLLKVDLSQIKNIFQSLTNVVIQLKDQPNPIILHHFFQPQEPTDHSLVLIDGLDRSTWVRLTNNAGELLEKPQFKNLNCYSDLLYIRIPENYSLKHKQISHDYDRNVAALFTLDYQSLLNDADTNLSDLEQHYLQLQHAKSA